MRWFFYLSDKTGVFGTIIAAMGCASCLPALGVLASALGLGFLTQFEGLFVNTLLPVFAGVALLANVLAYFSHRLWYRALPGISGPSMVLATLYPLWQYNWSTSLLYTGIVLMAVVSLLDIFLPPATLRAKLKTSNARTGDESWQ